MYGSVSSSRYGRRHYDVVDEITARLDALEASRPTAADKAGMPVCNTSEAEAPAAGANAGAAEAETVEAGAEAAELLKFIAEFGTAKTMPTEAQLMKHGRSDLCDAIARNGGSVLVAGQLGLQRQHGQRAKALSRQSTFAQGQYDSGCSLEEYAFAAELLSVVMTTWKEADDDGDGTVLGEIDDDQVASGTQAIVKQFRAWSVWHSEDMQAINREQKMDSNSVAAVSECGLNPDKFNVNSRCWWGPATDPPIQRFVKEAQKQIRKALGGYTATEAQYKRSKYLVLGYFVRIVYETRTECNFGATVLRKFDPPVLLIRCGTMMQTALPDSPFRSILEHGSVAHVFNIYSGHFPLYDNINKEQELCEERGIQYYNEATDPSNYSFRKLIESEASFEQHKAKAFKLCARQLQLILRPQGQDPKGNLVIHCGGGMHRTGMLVGILRRYCNPDDDVDDIIDDYRQHVAWQDPENPGIFQSLTATVSKCGLAGGAEELNERFIREFDLTAIDEQLAGDSAIDQLISDQKDSKRDQKGFLHTQKYTRRNWKRGLHKATKLLSRESQEELVLQIARE